MCININIWLKVRFTKIFNIDIDDKELILNSTLNLDEFNIELNEHLGIIDVENNKIHIKEYLQQGIDQGYIRGDLNVDVAAFLVEETTYTYIRAAYLEKPPFSFQQLFFTMMVNFIRGISTYKGIQIIDDYLTNNNSSVFF